MQAGKQGTALAVGSSLHCTRLHRTHASAARSHCMRRTVFPLVDALVPPRVKKLSKNTPRAAPPSDPLFASMATNRASTDAASTPTHAVGGTHAANSVRAIG
jgi:hypothetical protein